MSAFIVSKQHIDLIVALAYYGPASPCGQWYRPYFENKQLGFEQLDDLGELLTKENLSSIHARYPDTLEKPDDTPGPCEQYWLKPYTFNDPEYRPTIVEALKAVSCYSYQSCEHPEWEASEAKQLCECLTSSLIAVMPGYDPAPWEWDSDELLKRRKSARAA